MRLPLLRRSSLAVLFAAAPLLLTYACNSTPNIGVDSGSDRDGDSDSDTGNGGADSDSDSDIGNEDLGDLGDIGNGGTGPIGNGKPEICDGIDNNADGFIDNIDAGNDGVCDCIKIATIGIKGVHGAGDVFANWLDGKSTAGVIDIGTDELTADALKGFDVIVAQDMRGRTYTDDEVTALNEWMTAGGGLFTLIGYGDSNERANINQLLEPTGISYDSAQILSKSGGYTRPVDDFWLETHPVADGIVAIGVDNGYEVIGSGTVIATEGGYDMLRGKQIEDGRVLVWGDEWISYNSEWQQDEAAPVIYEVERFWLNAIKWLGPQESCQVAIPPTVR